MPIHSKTNLFPGINPHLNSALQQKGGDWRSFHSYHIIHIAEYLNRNLPDPYYAKPEKSLQIGTYDGELLPLNPSNLRADVLISREDETTSQSLSSQAQSSTAFITLPMTQYLENDDELDSLLIYSELSGKAVTRIELLSPANLPQGSHYGDYLRKRFESLKSGLRLVEIDYLHEKRPISGLLSSYADGESDSFPYYISVGDPRPTFERGKTEVYYFGVLDALPLVKIPLDNSDAVNTDFVEIYKTTFAERPFWRSVDYEQEPIHIDSYSHADQQAIRDTMNQIANEINNKK